MIQMDPLGAGGYMRAGTIRGGIAWCSLAIPYESGAVSGGFERAMTVIQPARWR